MIDRVHTFPQFLVQRWGRGQTGLNVMCIAACILQTLIPIHKWRKTNGLEKFSLITPILIWLTKSDHQFWRYTMLFLNMNIYIYDARCMFVSCRQKCFSVSLRFATWYHKSVSYKCCLLRARTPYILCAMNDLRNWLTPRYTHLISYCTQRATRM